MRLFRLLVACAAVVLAAGGCSSATAHPAPSPSATFGRAPAVGDVCAHVDPAALTAIIGGGVRGSHLGRTIPPAGLTDEGCVFHLAGGADLEVGLCPVAMVAVLPGADEALRDFLNTFDDDWKNHLVTGVGDRAVYDPLGTSTTLDLAAVKGSGLRWYGVVVFGYDPTPDRHVLGTVTEAQLALLATRTLDSVS